ncbi:hypothetical protein C8F01DRAFT_1032219 [Mycena amicta]|nr:hypothetical protein C8F01DRAFT_1032219 [Mycena amicta]
MLELKNLPLIRPLLLLSVGVVSVVLLSESRKKRFSLRVRFLEHHMRLLPSNVFPKLPFSLWKADTIHGTDLRVSRITIYPIKSCAGIDLQSCSYDKEGFEFDRKWMIVDLEKNKQLSARDNRGIKLVRVFPSIQGDPSSPYGGVMVVSFPNSPETPTFCVPLDPTPEMLEAWEIHRGFDLWGHADEGYVVESADPKAVDTPSEILSAFVGRPVLLVMKAPGLPSWGIPAGPRCAIRTRRRFLLVSEASLVDAQEKVRAMARGEYEAKVAGCKPDEPAPPVAEWADAKTLLMERFRPNVIMSGVDDAYGEDDWQEILAPDGHRFLLPMRCPRCMFPNVDTESGKRDPQMPNNAMMQYRKVEAAAPTKYCFGMYMIPVEDNGVLNVGDRIQVTRSAINPTLLDGQD